MNELMLLGDVVAGIVVGYVSGQLYYCAWMTSCRGFASLGPLWREIILCSLIAALVLKDPRPAGTRGEGDASRSASARKSGFAAFARRGGLALTILLSVGVATRTLDDMARLWVLGWLTLFSGYAVCSRLGLMLYLRRLEESGRLREAVAVVGAPDVASRMAARLAPDADVVSVLEDLEDGDDGDTDLLLGELRDLVDAGAIDTVVLAVRNGEEHDLAPLVEQLRAVPVQVAFCTDMAAPAPSHAVRMLSGVAMTIVADRAMTSWHLLQKAFLDKLGALMLLFLMAPVMLMAALAILWEDGSPVIFRQQRTGWSGRQFTIYKFRTMSVSRARGVYRQTDRNDPRCTRVGAFLRRASIDELPQLWNVMLGDMSLVGPRPHMEALHRNQRDGCQIIAEYAQRQRVKPGLTGWAQIHGLRGAVRTQAQMRRRVQYDLYYIENWSIWLDLQILAKTPICLCSSDNAF
jgi:putative colanic acid biosynthesis UDP-glucose lipid carrier transferase